MSTPGSQLPNTGPYLNVAVLCEKVIQEQNGPISIMRITDTLNRGAVGAQSPAKMEPFTAELVMIVMLRAGQAQGSFGVKIRPATPSGEYMPAFEQSVHLPGGPWGASLTTPMRFDIDETGVYWFDVILCNHAADAEHLLTRVPLEVIYSRTAAG